MEYEEIQNIFNKSFDMTKWKGTLRNLFTNFEEYKTGINRLEKNLTYHERANAITEFGSVLLADNKVIKLYDVLLNGDYDVSKSRVGLRNMIFRDIIPGDMEGIIAVFRSEGGKTWRLTFISKAIYWDDDFNERKLQTSPRRYTYVLGEGESVKTAAKQFESLFDKKVTIKQLIEAFNVDKLNKRFFNGYQKHYEKFVLELTGEIWKKKQNKYVLTKVQEPSPMLELAFYGNKKHARDFCKKLLGRIVFLHFLQKKGWMGCPVSDIYWENGEKQFMLELFKGYENKANFHSKCLTELFFNTLNKPDRNDIFKVEGLNSELNGSKVPYLNGGLFETDINCDPYKVNFPTSYFEELLDFFGQYNFTIDENSPDDHEVGIDPEMLGHIFENLLEENKEKGAFYTPKEIVQYMTQESLIQYLQTHLGEHEELTQFIRNNNIGDRTAKHNYIRDNAAKIEELLDNVKICDPAIGSGAFPMGMLNEIFEAKMALDMTLNRSDVKKRIIQNSIYGVDLESGAVDIARLRFWLALVVDEDIPHALPNLDYKIMQGNSLLESFEGIDLSQVHKGKAITIDNGITGDNLFSKVMEVQEVENEEKLEDLINTYFDLDNPEEKKEQHDKIDKQILGKIYKCLHDEFRLLESGLKKLNKKIKSKSASLSTAEQKIKYESNSKDARNSKKLIDQIDSIAQKQLKLKELYDSDDRPFFLWHLMFQDVFKQGGFDIVIGNPPYINANELKKSLGKEKYENLKSNFKVAKGTIDIYVLFFELSISVLKESGILTFINPNRYLSASYATALREFLFENCNILSLADYSRIRVFKEASTYPVVSTLRKVKEIQTADITIRSVNSNGHIEERSVESSDLTLLPGYLWGFLLNEKISISKKIISQSVRIDAVGKINATSTAKEADEYHDLINEIKGQKLINTGTIDRFSNTWGIQKLTDKGEKYLCPRLDISNEIVSVNRKSLYTAKKIILAKIALRTEAFFDRKGKYSSVNTNCIHSFSSDYLPEYILCWINSKLYQFLFESFFDGLRMAGGFLLYSAPNLLNTYIKPISLSEQKIYVHFSNLLEFAFLPSNPPEFLTIGSFIDTVLDSCIYELYFHNHMKNRGLDILTFIQDDFEHLFKSLDFNSLNEEEKKLMLIQLFEKWSHPDSPVKNRIQLFAIKSPEILKLIIESSR